MTEGIFSVTLSAEEVRELVGDHLDNRVFGMSMNTVNEASLSISIASDGRMSVSGKFEED